MVFGLAVALAAVAGRGEPAPSPVAGDASAGRTANLRNSVGVEFVLIPAGTFRMGSADGHDQEQPVHEVRITKPFYLGVYEVTNAQWKAVMGSVPSQWQDDDRPVERVNWDDAVAFCGRLSTLSEEKAVGRVYRLPTEAEWEYACRAGSATRYSFGDDVTGLERHGWFDGNSDGATHPVGRKQPNAWGLYDMHGNVWEWCADWYGAYSAEAAPDSEGPAAGSARIDRGGSWNAPAGYCRSARRYRIAAGSRSRDLGLRVALSAPGAQPPLAVGP